MTQFAEMKKVQLLNKFIAKKSVISVTKGVSSIIVNDYQFIDNPGFNDYLPDMNDSKLWFKLCEWLRNESNNVVSQGFKSFINIVSIPPSLKPSNDAYMNMAKLMLSLTIAYPLFPIEDLYDGKFPKIYTIFSNFSPNEKDIEDDDEDYEDYKTS